MIDGEFVSLYQYAGDKEQNLFTLTSVKDTPMGNYQSWDECMRRIKTFTPQELAEKKEVFEQVILGYLPTFRRDFGTF